MNGCMRFLVVIAVNFIYSTAFAAHVQMHELVADSVTDSFYTTKPSDVEIAKQIGASYHGIAFELDTNQVGGSKAFRRFYCPAPMTNHFYTHDINEVNYVTSVDCKDEGIEGYIFTSQIQGTTKLIRLVRLKNGGDLQHYWTVDPMMELVLKNEGWVSDGVVGWVYPSTLYCSEYVSELYPPSARVGEYYSMNVTMKNTCPGIWLTSDTILRVSGDKNWYPTAIPVPTNIKFGSNSSFNFSAKPPECAAYFGIGYCGDKRFVWRMKRGNLDFGPQTPYVLVLIGFGPPQSTSPQTLGTFPIVDSPLPYGTPVPQNSPLPPNFDPGF